MRNADCGLRNKCGLRTGADSQRGTATLKNAVSAVCSALLILQSIPHSAIRNPQFRDVAAEAGLDFRHVNGSTGEYFLPEIMAPGGALLDYDGDGDLDVFVVQGGTLDPRKPAAGAAGNRLFRNDSKPGPDGTLVLRFTDVTVQAGLAGAKGYGMGVAVGDYDNDGYPDLYVTNFGPNVLYHNNRDGTFTDVTKHAGVDDERWSASAAFLDYDRDGFLDLVVVNYVDFTVAGNKTCYDAVGARTYCTPSLYHAVPPRLFHNNRDGTFSDVTEASGISKAYGRGLGVASADFNGDGWIDIYVANDGDPNQLWINKGDGTFEDRGVISGTALNPGGLPEGSMGVAVGDFDNDGDEDIFVTNLTHESHALYVNRGNGDFEDLRVQAALAAPTFPFTGFGTDWFDYDNDGMLDLFVANGAVTTLETLRGDPFPFHQRNQLFRNVGNGRFQEIGPEGEPALALSEVSRGAAFGDIDNDGDVDILVTNNNGPVRLLLNQTGSRTHWLEVRLEGVQDNRAGLGSRVAVLRKGRTPLWRRAHTDGSYLSASDARVHFGLGASPDVDAVVVQWPNGYREMWNDVGADRRITLRQRTGKPVQVIGSLIPNS